MWEIFQAVIRITVWRRRNKIKGFAFGIRYLHGVMQYNQRLLAMPFAATSCCILKASLSRYRSCFLWNPVSHGSCENIQRDEELSRRSSSLWDPSPGFCRANSSHRLCRMLRSPEWCRAVRDDLLFLLSIIFFCVIAIPLIYAWKNELNWHFITKVIANRLMQRGSKWLF